MGMVIKMDILAQLQLLEDLTNSEKTLANYILNNAHNIPNMSSQEICEGAFVSVSTIYRLITKLELSGINDLKVKIAKSKGSNETASRIDFNFPIVPTDHISDLSDNLKNLYEETLSSTRALFNKEVLLEVSKEMLKANRITLFTSSSNVYFAQNFQFQMQEIGVYVDVPSEDYMMRLAASNSSADDLAIVISFGGRGKTTREVVKILKANKTKIVLITSTQDNPLKEIADYHIFMTSFEDHYQKVSSFSSRLSLLYILDMLYSIYFTENYEQNVHNKLQSYRKMEPSLE